MQNQLQVFENEMFGQVRVVMVEGEPWFVGKDVAEALGYKDTFNALKRHVDDEDKLNWRFTSSGQSREMVIINESGLYSLVMSSKLPDAKKFKRWVTTEVLPAIRKHGGYLTPEKVKEVLLNPDTIIQLATALKDEQAKNAELNKTVDALKPKADYCETILEAENAFCTTVIAKDYEKSSTWLNKYLHEKGIQYKRGSTWVLYQPYADQEYTKSHTYNYIGGNGDIESAIQTKWTQKGRKFIHDLLKADGIFPLVTGKQVVSQKN